MAAPKGHPRYGGRAAGTPNKKMTVPEMLRGAEQADDGVAYLVEQSRQNPATFMRLFFRVFASELAEAGKE